MNAVLDRYEKFLQVHLEGISSSNLGEFASILWDRLAEKVEDPERLVAIAGRIASDPLLPDQEVVGFFEEIYGVTDAWGWAISISEKKEALAVLLPYLANVHSSLDIGCGPAALDIFLAVEEIHKGKFVLIDPSRGMIDHGTRLAAKFGVNFQFDLGYGQELPYNDRSFDLILLMDTIHWSIEWQRILSEAERVMNEGAVIFVNYSNGAGRFSLDPMVVCRSMIQRGIDVINVTNGTTDPNRAFILGRKSKPSGLITLAGISSYKE